MDEFGNNEIFENETDNRTASDSNEGQPEEKITENEAEGIGENIPQSAPESGGEYYSEEGSYGEDIHSFSSESESETNEAFTFDENGEYHFTSPVSRDNAENAEPQTSQEQEQAHTSNNAYAYTQNPYRNPYRQDNNRQNGGYYQSQQNTGYTQPTNDRYGSYEPPKKPTKSSSKGKKILAALLVIVMLFASVGIGISIGQRKTAQAPTDSADTVNTTGDNATISISPTQTQTSQALDTVSPGIQVANKARGSVVGVVVYDANGTLYGEGSGVVMGLNDSKTLTYIITCAHVISDEGIKSCGIMMSDSTIYPAKIVGYDERTDIGVLSIEQTDLEAASFGDSNALQVGETVYAIGNPGGSEFYGSMTSGIVSALDRSISSTYTMSVIQHNAAISPGNSGGALVNSSGQVIGINSSKISATDYEGIGFAVPIAVAQPVVENLIKYGYVPNRPKLGISYASVSNYWRYSAIVQSKGLPAGSVIIASISDDSSFAGTEVAVGDMIISVNGTDMDKSDVLLDVIDKSKVGDEITLGICRIERSSSVGGSYKIKQFEVSVKLVEDKGSSASKDKEEETTTQSFYDYYYGNGNGNGDSYNNFDDFFSQFFGNGY